MDEAELRSKQKKGKEKYKGKKVRRNNLINKIIKKKVNIGALFLYFTWNILYYFTL